MSGFNESFHRDKEIVSIRHQIKILYLLHQRKAIHFYIDKNVLDHCILLYLAEAFKNTIHLIQIVCMLKKEWIGYIITRYGLDINQISEYALKQASIQKDVVKIKYLINIGADIDQKFSIDLYLLDKFPTYLYNILTSSEYPFIVYAAAKGCPLELFIPDIWTRYKQFYGIILSCAIINKDMKTVISLLNGMNKYFASRICLHDYLPLKCADTVGNGKLFRLMLRNIIKHRIPVNPHNKTLFYLVISYGNLNICKTLLDHGHKITPYSIEVAISKHNNDIAIYLIQQKLRDDDVLGHPDMLLESLFQAVKYRNSAMAFYILKGVTVTPSLYEENICEISYGITWEDCNPRIIMEASRKGELDIISRIYEGHPEELEWSIASHILYNSMQNNHKDMCNYILDFVELKNVTTNTFIQYCDKKLKLWDGIVFRGRGEIMSLLIDRGVRIRHPNYLLYKAVSHNYIDIARMLLDKGAKCTWFYEPMTKALKNRNLDMIKLLVEQGKATVKNKYISQMKGIYGKDSDLIRRYLTDIKLKTHKLC